MTNKKILIGSIIAGIAALMVIPVGTSYGGIPNCTTGQIPVWNGAVYVVDGTKNADIINCGNLSVNLLINGAKGADTITGGSGNDELRGGDDGDTLNGGSGADTLLGGRGGDTIDCGTDAVTDTVEGGLGIDNTLNCDADIVSLGQQ